MSSDLITTRTDDAVSLWSDQSSEARSIELNGREFELMGAPSACGMVVYVDRLSGDVALLFLSRFSLISGKRVMFELATSLVRGLEKRFVWVDSGNIHGVVSPTKWAVVGPITNSGVLEGAGAWQW